jgi:hypothetical protein
MAFAATIVFAVPRIAAASISVSPTVSDIGYYTVSWTDQSNTYTHVYLYSSTEQPIRVAGPGSRSYAAMAVGTYSYKIVVYRYDIETRRETFWYQTPYMSVVVTDHRNYMVGVLAGSTTCQSGLPAELIFMDNEDACSFPNICQWPTSSTTGWTGATNTDPSGNTNFYFCPVDGTSFKPLTTVADYTKEYALLKLGSTCPNGSIEFGRFFDNEDSNNASRNSGHISPNYQDAYGNSMLRFCLFRYGPDIMQPDPYTGAIFPALGFSYGAFAASDFYFAVTGATGLIYTDDEDSNTASYFDIPSTLDVTAVYRIIDGYPHYGGNTSMHTALLSNQ